MDGRRVKKDFNRLVEKTKGLRLGFIQELLTRPLIILALFDL